MAGTSVGWHPDPANPARERYWDGGAWSRSVPAPEAARQRREVRQQAIFVITLMIIIALAWLLYMRPWQREHPRVHPPIGPVHMI